MLPHLRKHRIPAGLIDRLHVAAAVAAEQVLEEHTRSAVELIEEGAGRAPVERLIGVYARLHHFKESDTHKLRERVLAALGRNGHSPAELAGPRSPFARLRRRLRGRVDTDLRDWVEQHTARVELTLLNIHVENALDTIRIVDDSVPVGHTITTYVEMLELRPTIAEMVRLRVLKVLHDRASGSVSPLRPDRSRPYPLRVAENDR